MNEEEIQRIVQLTENARKVDHENTPRSVPMTPLRSFLRRNQGKDVAVSKQGLQEMLLEVEYRLVQLEDFIGVLQQIADKQVEAEDGTPSTP